MLLNIVQRESRYYLDSFKIFSNDFQICSYISFQTCFRHVSPSDQIFEMIFKHVPICFRSSSDSCHVGTPPPMALTWCCCRDCRLGLRQLFTMLLFILHLPCDTLVWHNYLWAKILLYGSVLSLLMPTIMRHGGERLSHPHTWDLVLPGRGNHHQSKHNHCCCGLGGTF